MAYLLSSKPHLDIAPYEKKIAELHLLIEKEAKRLQDIIDKKEFAIQEIRILGVRKENLVNTISKLEKEIKLVQEKLEDSISKKTSFIESSKQELKKEKTAFQVVSKNVELLNKQIINFENVIKELNDFISKENNARQRYLIEQEKLNKVKKEHLIISEEIKKEKEFIETEKRESDKSKQSLTDLSAKLSAYSYQVRLATVFLNKSLKDRKVPLTYGLPTNKITEIKFNE